MKQSINFSQFTDAFRDMDRKEQFTYEGLKALYEYIEQLDEDCGTETELDVIALCCDFTEYSDLADLQANYSNIESMEDLQDHTMVIPIEDIYGQPTKAFIIQNF